MSEIALIVVTYRDVFLWTAKLKGEKAEDLQKRSALVKLSSEDLQALGTSSGRPVKLKSDSGEVVVRAEVDSACPKGIAFMPLSPYVAKLAGYDGTRYKLPDFKRIQVLVESTENPISPLE
ncbi:MAG: molybdopterin dinucleotide binding domain-containing protein [Desulfatiglans sp.]|jgi:formylmethanofuran dehydrogenase subunit D|nr:molybdopterin dinucleotide binding domain-containing protein [Desulfatiglans sp.]